MDTHTHITPARTLVLGIGNTLLGDEGIGVHAMHALRAQLPDRDDIECLDGGTLSFTLAGPIEDTAQLIIIDAAQLQSAPGTVAVFVDDDLDRYLGSHRKRSVHEVGLIDLMIIARLTGRLPRRRALIGVQPECVDWSENPSPLVAAATPDIIDKALSLIQGWQHEPA